MTEDDDAGPSSGSTYVFDAVTHAPVLRLRPFLSTIRGSGGAVALDGTTVFIGAQEVPEGAVFHFGPVPTVGHRNAGTNPDSFTSSLAFTDSTLRFTIDLTTTGRRYRWFFQDMEGIRDWVMSQHPRGDEPAGTESRAAATDEEPTCKQ